MKKRDKEDTNERLVRAVGTTLLEYGHQAIGINRISLVAGVSKSAIYDNFGGLNSLVKTYIGRKDFWLPFFDQLNAPDPDDRQALCKFYSLTLQEEFLYFFGEPEMQRLILWQISTVSPLMRTVSETREAEGRKLLALAEPYFQGTGMNFKAVSAIIVGGIYYMVLHAAFNKSPVCGIDVNHEKDRATVLKTISQLVSMSWEKAAEQSADKTNMPMNYETEVIEAIVAGITAKGKAGAARAEADEALRQEAKRLEKNIEAHCLTIRNGTQLGSFVNMTLQKLVVLSNRVYAAHEVESTDVALLLELITAVKRAVPQSVSRQLSLPLAFVARQQPALRARWKKLEAQFTEKKIDHLLIGIAGIPVSRFSLDSDGLNWGDYVWLKRYFVMLEGTDWDNPGCTTADDALMSQLMRLNFNHQRFAAYGYRLLRGKTDSKKGRREKLNELLRYRTIVVQDSPLSDHRYEVHSESISTLFCNWIDAEVTLVRQTATDEGEKMANPLKFRQKLNALCTAFWYKLQNDHGVLDEKVEELAEKIAFNCSTPQQDELSEGSQRTKFYTKDRRVLKIIEDILVKMLADVRQMLA